MKKARSYPTIDDIIRLDPYLDRKAISDNLTITHGTLKSKISKRRKGRDINLNFEDQKRLKEHLLDVHELLTVILND